MVAFLGAAAAYVESALRRIYKPVPDSTVAVGVLHRKGLGWRVYAIVFAVATVFACGVLLPGVQTKHRSQRWTPSAWRRRSPAPSYRDPARPDIFGGIAASPGSQGGGATSGARLHPRRGPWWWRSPSTKVPEVIRADPVLSASGLDKGFGAMSANGYPVGCQVVCILNKGQPLACIASCRCRQCCTWLRKASCRPSRLCGYPLHYCSADRLRGC